VRTNSRDARAGTSAAHSWRPVQSVDGIRCVAAARGIHDLAARLRAGGSHLVGERCAELRRFLSPLANSLESAYGTWHKFPSRLNHATENDLKRTKPTLLVLAAGMGSRYGGLKQIDPVGPSGETIIDYSIFDALRAGFGKLVFVIRH